MIDDEPPDVRPAPPGVRVSTELVEAGITDRLCESDRDELRAGRIRWTLEPFDEIGLGRLTVFLVDGEMIGDGFVHWSAIVENA